MWRSHCNSRRLDFSWKTSVLRPFFRKLLQSSLEAYIGGIFDLTFMKVIFPKRAWNCDFFDIQKCYCYRQFLWTLFILTHFAIFGKKESVSLKEGCNEKKNTKGVSPLTMTDSPIRKTFTGNVSSTYNFYFSSDRNLPHALGLREEWHLNCWLGDFLA